MSSSRRGSVKGGGPGRRVSPSPPPPPASSTDAPPALAPSQQIFVAIRVRPLPAASPPPGVISVNEEDGRSILVRDPGHFANNVMRERRKRDRTYTFDRAFGPSASNEEVYVGVGGPSLTDALLSGVNATVFAYGPTGSGKTYTMMGSNVAPPAAAAGGGDASAASDDGYYAPGLMSLALADLFEAVAARNARGGGSNPSSSSSSSSLLRVTITYIELYNENIRDLLVVPGASNSGAGGGPAGAPSWVSPLEGAGGNGGPGDGAPPAPESLDLREDPVRGPCVAGVSEHRVTTVAEVEALLSEGNRRRTQEPTAANETSSRSHAILQVYLSAGDAQLAKLSLVDLAGSERAANTHNRGIRLWEGANINRSLLALGNVITALASASDAAGGGGGSGAGGGNGGGPAASSFIPWRDSKLTRLLKDSLGGHCRTVMLVLLNPASASYEETINSLKYGARAKRIAAVEGPPPGVAGEASARKGGAGGAGAKPRRWMGGGGAAPAPAHPAYIAGAHGAPDGYVEAAVVVGLRAEVAALRRRLAAAGVGGPAGAAAGGGGGFGAPGGKPLFPVALPSPGAGAAAAAVAAAAAAAAVAGVGGGSASLTSTPQQPAATNSGPLVLDPPLAAAVADARATLVALTRQRLTLKRRLAELRARDVALTAEAARRRDALHRWAAVEAALDDAPPSPDRGSRAAAAGGPKSKSGALAPFGAGGALGNEAGASPSTALASTASGSAAPAPPLVIASDAEAAAVALDLASLEAQLAASEAARSDIEADLGTNDTDGEAVRASIVALGSGSSSGGSSGGGPPPGLADVLALEYRVCALELERAEAAAAASTSFAVAAAADREAAALMEALAVRDAVIGTQSGVLADAGIQVDLFPVVAAAKEAYRAAAAAGAPQGGVSATSGAPGGSKAGGALAGLEGHWAAPPRDAKGASSNTTLARKPWPSTLAFPAAKAAGLLPGGLSFAAPLLQASGRGEGTPAQADLPAGSSSASSSGAVPSLPLSGLQRAAGQPPQQQQPPRSPPRGMPGTAGAPLPPASESPPVTASAVAVGVMTPPSKRVAGLGSGGANAGTPSPPAPLLPVGAAKAAAPAAGPASPAPGHSVWGGYSAGGGTTANKNDKQTSSNFSKGGGAGVSEARAEVQGAAAAARKGASPPGAATAAAAVAQPPRRGRLRPGEEGIAPDAAPRAGPAVTSVSPPRAPPSPPPPPAAAAAPQPQPPPPRYSSPRAGFGFSGKGREAGGGTALSRSPPPQGTRSRLVPVGASAASAALAGGGSPALAAAGRAALGGSPAGRWGAAANGGGRAAAASPSPLPRGGAAGGPRGLGGAGGRRLGVAPASSPPARSTGWGPQRASPQQAQPAAAQQPLIPVDALDKLAALKKRRGESLQPDSSRGEGGGGGAAGDRVSRRAAAAAAAAARRAAALAEVLGGASGVPVPA